MSKFSNKNWLAVCLFLVFAATTGLFFTDQVRAALTCSITSSCADVTLLKMYATGNSHAGLPASSAYTNLVCCADAAAGLSNNCSGTFAPAGTLSSTNNAHYEDWTKTNYSSPANDFCLSVTSGTVTVSTSTDCGTNATLFSFSGTTGTNAHVGNSAAYPTKVCATTTVAAVSITLDRSSFAYGSVPPNSASSTIGLWSGAGITATNGEAPADFYIYGANTTNWTLDTATSTPDHYIHWFCNDTDNVCTTPPTNYTAMTTSPALLKSSVAASGTCAFQLRIGTPNPSTVFTQQSAVVTIQASAP